MTALEIATQITSWRKDQGILEELSTATYTDWMRCFREIGWTIASNTTFNNEFGGEGLTVELDETFLKSKKCSEHSLSIEFLGRVESSREGYVGNVYSVK
jgi:hypothetical protein